MNPCFTSIMCIAPNHEKRFRKYDKITLQVNILKYRIYVLVISHKNLPELHSTKECIQLKDDFHSVHTCKNALHNKSTINIVVLNLHKATPVKSLLNLFEEESGKKIMDLKSVCISLLSPDESTKDLDSD